MVEYYTFMHKGGKEEYKDNIYLSYTPVLTVLIYYGSNSTNDNQEKSELMGRIISASKGKTFEEVSEMINKTAPADADYALIKISDKAVNCERHGSVFPYIVKNGELKILPNGIMALEDSDRIICATSKFYEELSELSILSDALTSLSCEEWMDNLLCRISEHNMLDCGNLTAVNFIVRTDD